MSKKRKIFKSKSSIHIFRNKKEDVYDEIGSDEPKTASSKQKEKAQAQKAASCSSSKEVVPAKPKKPKATKSKNASKASELPDKKKLREQVKPNAKAQDLRGKADGAGLSQSLRNAVLQLQGLKSTVPKRGPPYKYTEEAIKAGLAVKALMGLGYRGLEGSMLELAESMGFGQDIPDHSTFHKRSKDFTPILKVPALTNIIEDSKLHRNIVSEDGKSYDAVYAVDSTGIKLSGQGEWMVRQHGYSYRRGWFKLHLLVEVQTMLIVGFIVTENNVHDSKVLETLLPEDLTNCLVLADGAYHHRFEYQLVHDRGGQLVSPLPVNAEMWNYCQKEYNPAYVQRDRSMTICNVYGIDKWKTISNYSFRSLAETSMNRVKTHIVKASSTSLERFAVEMASVLNHLNFITMVELEARAKGVI